MLEKGSSKSKTGIYKTMDGRCREAKPSPAAGSDTVALLSSLKTQSKAPKSGPSYNSRTHAGNETKQSSWPASRKSMTSSCTTPCCGRSSPSFVPRSRTSSFTPPPISSTSSHV